MFFTALILMSRQPIDPQIKCLADNMYHEARGESEKGKIAVSNVVMNRVNSSKFPSTPCKVIHERKGKSCQFSWTCRKPSVREHSIYQNCLEIAKKIYNGSIKDITNGALFFDGNTRKSGLKIGRHVFRR
jgi:spore germination cell wall hydrolase CwlJ-like protein